jgi:hypothetical protein
MRIIFVAAVLAAFALTACASVTAGSGRGQAVAPAPTTSSTSAPAPAPTDAPSTSSGSAPSTTTQQHICQERCRTVARADLGDGLSVELAQAPGAMPISVIIVRRDGELRTAGWIDDERPGSLTCSTRPEPNCVVVDDIAMHAAKAWGVTFADDNVDLYDHVTTDTPVIVAKDLDGTGWIDVVAEQSTERPSYAAAPRFWVSFVSDGHHLTGTGCTTPTMHEQPEPTIVLTGDCT